ncbi:MAG: hypothetical protein RIG62_17350 [Cyclobacteriaceae bacterium]
MKKLMYLSCLLLLLGCGDDEEPTPGTMDNVAPSTTEARMEFFADHIASRQWKLSRFNFSDTTRFFRDSTLVQDLFSSLPMCRRNISYEWSYLAGIVYIDFIDPQPCSAGESTRIDEGLILRDQSNPFLNTGTAEFKGQWAAVNKLLNINAGGMGITGWNEFDMHWSTIMLTKDSINIEGAFSNLNRDVPLPSFSLQFVPI